MLVVTKTNRNISSSLLLRVMGEISQWHNMDGSLSVFQSYIQDKLSSIKQTRFAMMYASSVVEIVPINENKIEIYATKINGDRKFLMATVEKVSK